MSWYSSSPSDDLLDNIHTYNMDEGWRMIADEELAFVDVALQVGNCNVIRIILPSGGVFSIDGAKAIRDALTKTIEEAGRELDRPGN